MEPKDGNGRLNGMTRLVIGVTVAVLSLAGCGVAHAAGGGHSGSASRAVAGRAVPKGYLPVLTARQVAGGHLVSRPWALVRLTQRATVAEIRYSFGGCQPRPRGVMVTESVSAVTLTLAGPAVRAGSACTPDLIVGTARVQIPSLGSRVLRHAPAQH